MVADVLDAEDVKEVEVVELELELVVMTGAPQL
jgi:hypothetical protein